MKCEKCNHNEATIHLTEIYQNIKSELHLCEKCARESGIQSCVNNLSIPLSDALSLFDGQDAAHEKGNIYCRFCGQSLTEYQKTSKFGCPYCYVQFQFQLSFQLQMYYSYKGYFGNPPLHYIEPNNNNLFLVSAANAQQLDPEKEIEKLKKMLKFAIINEQYEEAAKLRDKIRELEKFCIH